MGQPATAVVVRWSPAPASTDGNDETRKRPWGNRFAGSQELVVVWSCPGFRPRSRNVNTIAGVVNPSCEKALEPVADELSSAPTASRPESPGGSWTTEFTVCVPGAILFSGRSNGTNS